MSASCIVAPVPGTNVADVLMYTAVGYTPTICALVSVGPSSDHPSEAVRLVSLFVPYIPKYANEESKHANAKYCAEAVDPSVDVRALDKSLCVRPEPTAMYALP